MGDPLLPRPGPRTEAVGMHPSTPENSDTPGNTTGDGTIVVYGAPSAEHILHVYADPRCPYCKRMEDGIGVAMQQLADDGDFALHYHFATFLDDALGGSGSHHALNALGAAADAGQGAFLSYLRTLYAHQPPEESDDFSSTELLLTLADSVEGLRTPAFEKAVSGMRYGPWVDRVSAAFDAGEVAGTPTVLLDRARVTVLDRHGYAVAPEEFAAQIRR